MVFGAALEIVEPEGVPPDSLRDVNWHQRYSNSAVNVLLRHVRCPTLQQRPHHRLTKLTGAKAFELKGMDPSYIDIDGFWLRDADSKDPESALIANEYYAGLEIGGRPSR